MPEKRKLATHYYDITTGKKHSTLSADPRQAVYHHVCAAFFDNEPSFRSIPVIVDGDAKAPPFLPIDHLEFIHQRWMQVYARTAGVVDLHELGAKVEELL